MCLIADIATLVTWTGLILKVAIGLGAVIFVHELGHFLVAKACGVKCEKFFIGFDIGGYKLSHKWGETEYGIGILPLGGYVKMLGQDDDPARMAEQMQKSQVDAKSSDAVPIIGPDGETYYVDRRSYLAKSVPQRMAIISAGVVMNVIFAFIFAVIAFGMGVPYLPCIVAETAPGSPAWQAGIEPGDEIIQIDARQNPSFTQLRGGVTLGDLKHGIDCVVRRAADGREVEIVLLPEQGAGLAKVGIVPPRSLELLAELPAYEDSPAAAATLAGSADLPAADKKLRGGDKIVMVGDVPVADYRELAAELAAHPDMPLEITVLRTEATADEGAAEVVQELTFEVPARAMRRFGLVMKMGPITAIQAGSPAVEAGLEVGDVIAAVDGRPMAGVDGNYDSWDPLSLPESLRRAALDGRAVELEVLRQGAGDVAGPLTVTLTPRVPRTFVSGPFPGSGQAAEAAGIVYAIEDEVQSLVPGSPASAADLRAGDVITDVQFIPADDGKDLGVDELLTESPAGLDWPVVMEILQRLPPGTGVALTIERDGRSHEVALEAVDADGLYVADRGFVFEPIERIRRADTFAGQVRMGWDETVDSLTMVYRFLQKIGTQVPVTALGGPVTIAKAAGYSASEGVAKLLVFLTMLSANLAVINFLPIPLLDGGHMVFLAWEAIRGRPASEKFVVAMHTAGFVFIISLMLFVIALDFGLIPRGL